MAFEHAMSVDHLVGSAEQRVRHAQAEHSGQPRLMNSSNLTTFSTLPSESGVDRRSLLFARRSARKAW